MGPSDSTVTAPLARSTSTCLTWSSLDTSSVTAATQCPQVMPVTLKTVVVFMMTPRNCGDVQNDYTPGGYRHATYPGEVCQGSPQPERLSSALGPLAANQARPR